MNLNLNYFLIKKKKIDMLIDRTRTLLIMKGK